jgi:hypothetical protein
MPKITKAARIRRKPHNVQREHYESFGELLATIAGEPRQAIIGDKQVTLTRMEALLRVQVERALNRNVREVAQLLQILANDPGLAATTQTIVVSYIGKALANV